MKYDINRMIEKHLGVNKKEKNTPLNSVIIETIVNGKVIQEIKLKNVVK